MARIRRTKSGYTLIEVLLVVSVVAVLAMMVVTNAGTAVRDRLDSVTRIIATDIAYARSLAVANGSEYRYAFDARNATYTLTHVGSDTAWDSLPPSPFHSQTGPDTAHEVALADLPHMGGNVQILGAFTVASDNTLTRVDTVIFGALGQTHDRAEETVVWFSDGASSELRYQAIRINPVTGLATIDEFTGVAPSIPAAVAAASPGGTL